MISARATLLFIAIIVWATAAQANVPIIVETGASRRTVMKPLRNYTAEEWLREWLQGKKATKAEGTFLSYENAINSFLTSLGNRAKLNVNQVAPRDVLRWRDGRILDGLHPSTANDQVKIVRMAFSCTTLN